MSEPHFLWSLPNFCPTCREGVGPWQQRNVLDENGVGMSRWMVASCGCGELRFDMEATHLSWRVELERQEVPSE